MTDELFLHMRQVYGHYSLQGDLSSINNVTMRNLYKIIILPLT